MRRFAVLAVFFLAACASTTPVPISGADVCFRCRRGIGDPTLAAEIIDATQHAYKFRTVNCLAAYLKEHPGEQVRAIFVTDSQYGKLIRAEHAYFVQFESDQRLRTKDYMAFRSRALAESFAQEQKSEVLSWQQVFERIDPENVGA